MLRINAAFVVSMLLIASPAMARPDITLNLQAKKIVEVKGKKTYQDAQKAAPGDILEYTIKVFNKGNSGAMKLSPIGNIPPTTEYIPEKFDNKLYTVLFSIDQGKTFQEQPTMIRTSQSQALPLPAA